MGIISRTGRINDLAGVDGQETEFAAIAARMAETIAKLPDNAEAKALAGFAERLMLYGTGDGSVFALRRAELRAQQAGDADGECVDLDRTAVRDRKSTRLNSSHSCSSRMTSSA